ncbi:hypothetical protein Q73_03265 [Bacillus coahuilensis m2-6]|nr:hypothetical protein Q73_03265 [Bacillus coahuilensis m2-6]
MFPKFDGSIVHPLFSTASMVHYMEWVSRNLLLPFLEQDEEAVGAEVIVKHRGPAKLGDEILFEGRIIAVQENKMLTKILAKVNDRTIGVGEVTQIILPIAKIERFYNE